jgi:hypothetical protein
MQWSALRWARVVAGNFVSCNESMKVMDNRVSQRAEFYLSREEKERRGAHIGGSQGRLSLEALCLVVFVRILFPG